MQFLVGETYLRKGVICRIMVGIVSCVRSGDVGAGSTELALRICLDTDIVLRCPSCGVTPNTKMVNKT